MASVETTTIRIRRSTHKRLEEEAERQGNCVMELVDEAAQSFEEHRLLELEEQQLLASAVRAWAKMAETPAEEFGLDGALTDEEIAQLELDET
jgi:hypothetical protein